MKNISRRVFIKGMAVAAAATAASTVLAGCNFVPGNEEKGEETGFAPIEKTIEINPADDKQVVTMTVSGYEYNSTTGILAISGKVVNDSDQRLYLAGSLSAAGYVKATAYVDSLTNLTSVPLDASTVSFNDSLAGKHVASKTNDTAAGVAEGKLYYVVKEANKDWKAITLVVEAVDTDGHNVEPVKFVINR